MRAAIFDEPRSITIGDRPGPSIVEPTDAIIRVIAPFAISDGTCPHRLHGITTACANGGFYPSNGDGGQGEAVRIPWADGTLAAADVMGTGHHAAVCAQVKPGQTVAAVGDGAVGLSAVPAAKRLGADRIIALSRHADRQALATIFGGTDIVAERARPGSIVGYVGVPHGVELPVSQMYYANVGVVGGRAPARTYLPELLDDVLAGTINPGLVLDFETSLAGGIDADVTLHDADASVLDAVDAAYRTKYGARYASIVDPITGDAHRVSTLRLEPTS